MHSGIIKIATTTRRELQHHHHHNTTRTSTKKERKEGERIKVTKLRKRERESGREIESVKMARMNQWANSFSPFKSLPSIKEKIFV